MITIRIVLFVSLITCGLVGSVSALTISTIDGEWTGHTGGSNITENDGVYTSYGNQSEDQIRWGTSRSGNQSGLGFTGAASSTFNVGDVFELGQIQHFNNPIRSGTQATAAFLSVDILFSDPSGQNSNFNFNFDIDETPNRLGAPFSDDIITFPTAYSSDMFTIDGLGYTLQILGFADNAGSSYLTSFSSPEGGDSTTNLYASVSAAPVPEPATMLLFGTGLLGLFGARFRKKKNNSK